MRTVAWQKLYVFGGHREKSDEKENTLTINAPFVTRSGGPVIRLTGKLIVTRGNGSDVFLEKNSLEAGRMRNLRATKKVP